MSEQKVSPLLDAMEIGECFASHGGVRCCWIRHSESGREFVLKHISVPPTQDQVQALLLTGACATTEQAGAYYLREAEDLVREVEERKKLLDCPFILPFLGVQMEEKAEGVGYDVYTVLPKRSSLQSFLNGNSISHLRGINMGIDICVALAALREEGYIFGNLKPGNIFFSDSGRFLLGDFGLLPTEDMQYGVLPEQYRSSYTAPELRNFIGGLNTTVDIYALGMILYRIYNGNHAPFEDEKTPARAADLRRLDGEALPAPLYADYELTEIIQKACAYEPADRYQTPDEMRMDLEQYMRRNAVSDHLIVPPLVTDGAKLTPEPPAPEAPKAPEEPGHFAAPETPDASENKKRDRKRKKDRKKEKTEKPAEKAGEKPAAAPEKPAEKAEKPAAPEKTAEKPAAEPEKPAEKPAEKPVEPPAAAPEKPAEKPAEKPGEAPAAEPEQPAEKAGASEEKPAEPREQPGPAEKPPAVLPDEPGVLPEKKPDGADRPAGDQKKASKKAADRKKSGSDGKKPGSDEAEPASGGKKKRGKGWIALLLLLLAVGFVALWEFGGVGKGQYHFLVRSQMEVTDMTADALRVRVDTNINESACKLLCTDAYGNVFESPVRNGKADFTGLTPGTRYQLKLEVSGLHKLTGATSLTASTKPRTEILSFTAEDAAPGALRLNLVLRDENTEPAEWVLAYAPEGAEQEKEFRFSGRSCRLEGLEGGVSYRFRLLESEDLFLGGQTELTFTPLREILADSLSLDGVLNRTATLSWRCAVDPPEAWTVTCTDSAGQELEVSVNPDEADGDFWRCSAAVAGVAVGETYTLRVSAPGLAQPLSLMFNGAWVRVRSLQVREATVEEAVLSWDCVSDPPEQWLLTCADSSEHSLEVELLPDEPAENGWTCSAVVRGLQPGAAYSAELFAVGMDEAAALRFNAPYIRAENLLLDSLNKDTATVSWSCDTEHHETWQLSCRDSVGRTPEISVNPDKLNENSLYCSAVLRSLRPGEVYTLELFTEGMERPVSLSIRTPFLAVEALSLEEIAGPEARLSWTSDRGDHAPWQLSCLTAEGAALHAELSQDIPGEAGVRSGAVIRGLQAGMHCTVELFCEGMEQPARLEFDMPALQVGELQLDGLTGSDAHISWSCDSEAHAPWQLTCTADDGTALAVDVNPDKLNEDSFYCSATVHGVAPGAACVLELYAPGMEEAQTLEFQRGAVLEIGSLAAELGEEGVTLTWTASAEPTGGWRIVKACGSAESEAVVEGSGCVLAVLPDTDYTFTILPADGQDCTGENTVSLRTGTTYRFSGFGVQGEGTTIGTYYTPNKENWTDRDLGSGTVTYKQSDRITFQITVNGTPEDTDQLVTTQCVVRDTEENILHVTEEIVPWNSLWQGKKWNADVPWFPEENGSYTFTVYINGRRLGTIAFRMVG